MPVMTDRKCQKAIVTGGANATRVLYWIKEYVNTFLPAAGFGGRLTVVASSGVWANDAAVPDLGYVVIQPVTAWGDATRWQIVFAAKNAAGASTIAGAAGGLAIPGAGVYAAFSVSGGWDDDAAQKNFGAVPNTGLLNVAGAGTTGTYAATGLHLACIDRMVSGVASGCSIAFAFDNGLSGSWTGSTVAGHSFWLNSAYTKPHQFFVGLPNLLDNNLSWGYVSGARCGRVLNAAGTAYNHACVGLMRSAYVANALLERDTSGWAAIPLFYRDFTLTRTVGWFNGVWQTDTNLADKAEDTDQNFIVVGDCLFPSSP